jgi:ubiquinone/menaquinone biosynthesis C-methylase UbiE
MKDRFEKVSEDYGKLFIEVYKEKGSDYLKIEKSVFENVKKAYPNFKEAAILDIGTGDGLTIEPFVVIGCKDLTGIDLNSFMLEASRKKFGDKVKLINASATDMKLFETRQFPIITCGMCIHNIPKQERKKFWNEIIRLNPNILCLVEKIAGDDLDNYKKDYESELAAIEKIFGKYGLYEENEEWKKHFIYDEQPDVKMHVSEVTQNLSPQYDIKIVNEDGMYKTVLCVRKG